MVLKLPFSRGLLEILLCLAIPMVGLGSPGPWQINAPAPEAILQEGRIFIAVSLEDGYVLKSRSVKVWLNQKEITQLARVTENNITLLYFKELQKGRYEIVVSAEEKGGAKLPELKWQFTIGDTAALLGDTVASLKPSKKRKRIGMVGQLNAGSDFHQLEGPGAALRQEPPQTQVVQFSAKANYRSISVPIKLYYTSNDLPGSPSRNRLQIGVLSKNAAVYYGDNLPVISPLMLGGARIRGWQGELHLGRFHASYVEGAISRGIEGEIRQLSGDAIFTPPTLGRDSTYIIPGVYRRKIQAASIALGKNSDKPGFRLSVLKGQDDTSSIQYGGPPQENFVLSNDFHFKTKDNKFKLVTGASMSLTTRDFAQGALTKATIDSSFGTDIPVDPAKFSKVLHINTSTVPLAVHRLSSLAWYVDGGMKFKHHRVQARYQEIGAAYGSFGNPYLRNDRRGFSLSDRVFLWERKLMTSIRWQQYTNNLSANQINTFTNNNISANLQYHPGPKWPLMHVGYRYNWRQTGPLFDYQSPVHNVLNNIMVGGNYRFDALGLKQQLMVQYSQAFRKDLFRLENENVTRSLMLNLNEELPIPISFNVQYVLLQIHSGRMGRVQFQQVLAGEVNFHLMQDKMKLNVGFQNIHIAVSMFSTASNRSVLQVAGNYNPMEDLALELQIGYSNYKEAVSQDRFYSDRYIKLRLVYDFQFGGN